jgi:hypothetical protein
MARPIRVFLIAALALVMMLALTPVPAAARVFVGGGGWIGPGWGWGWGPGWYGWGPAPAYYWGPPAGKVKIDTHDRDASVYVDGGYAGPVAHMKKFSLRPGAHDLEVLAPNGQPLFNQRIEVIQGRTTEIHVGS